MNPIGQTFVITIIVACIIFSVSWVWFEVGYTEAVKERAEMCERFQVIDLLDKTYTCVEKIQ